MAQPNPHDAFVKAVFSRPENAAGELKAVLPPALLAHLDLSSIESSPKSFVDEKLTWRHSDLLLKVTFAGRPAFLYVLLEHQSTPDPLLVVRLAVYMGRLWDEWLRENEDKGAARAPAVIPLVLYHGSTGWTAATELVQAFDLDLFGAELEAVRPHLPNFRILLDDLVRQADGDLRRREAAVLGRIALLMLKHLRRVGSDMAELQRFLSSVRDLILLLPLDRDRPLVLSYIVEVADPADLEAVKSAVGQAVTPEIAEELMTLGEKLRRDGRLEGRRIDLARLLGKKFPGQVTPEIEQRIQAADEATLGEWLDRLLVATSLEQVLRPA